MGQILMWKNSDSYVYLLLFYYLLPYTTFPVLSELVKPGCSNTIQCSTSDSKSKLGEIRVFKYVNYDELSKLQNLTNHDNKTNSTEAIPLTSTDRSLIPNSFFSSLNLNSTRRIQNSSDIGDLETSASNVSERPRRSPYRYLPGNNGLPRAPLYRATQPAPALAPTSYAYQTGPTAYYDYDYGVSAGASAASPPEEPSYNYPRFRRPPRPPMGNRVRIPPPPAPQRRRPVNPVPRPPRPVPRPMQVPRPHRNAQGRQKIQAIGIPAAPQYSYPRDAANIQDILNYFTNEENPGSQRIRPQPPIPQPLPSSAPDFSTVSLGSDFSKELHDVQTSLLKDIREFARRPSIMESEQDHGSPAPPIKSGSLDYNKRVPPPTPPSSYHEQDDEHGHHEDEDSFYEKPKPVRELIKPKHKYASTNSRERDEDSHYVSSREKERERMRELERKEERARAKQLERERAREIERDKEREREKERAREKERERTRELEKERAREKEREKAREKERERVREVERERQREKEREKAREKERERAREVERERVREKERVKQREKNRNTHSSYNEEDDDEEAGQAYHGNHKKLPTKERTRSGSQERINGSPYVDHDHHEEPSHEENYYYPTKVKTKPKYAPPPPPRTKFRDSDEESERKNFNTHNKSPSTPLVLKRPYGPYRPPEEALHSAEYRRRIHNHKYSTSPARQRERESYKPDLYLRPPPTPQESTRYNLYKPSPTGLADVVEIHTNPPFSVDVLNREKERNDRIQKLYLDYLERKLEAESAINAARPSTLAPVIQQHPTVTKKPMRMKIHIYPNSKSDQEDHPVSSLPQPPVDHPKYFNSNPNLNNNNYPYPHRGGSNFQASSSYSSPVRNNNIPNPKSGPGPDGYRLQSNMQHRQFGTESLDQNFGEPTRLTQQQLDAKNKNLVLHLHVHRRSDGGIGDITQMEGSEVYTSTVKPLTYKEIYDGTIEDQLHQHQHEEDNIHNDYHEEQLHPINSNPTRPENKISMEVPIQDEKIGDVLTTLLKFRERKR